MVEWGPGKDYGTRGPSRKEKSAAVAARMLKVAELHSARVPQHEIAKTLDVSTATICQDLKRIRAAWALEYRERLDEARDRELAAIAKDERRARQRLVKLKEDDTKGFCYLMKVILELMERRAKIQGTDAPTKVESKIDATVSDRRLDLETLTDDVQALATELSTKIYLTRRPSLASEALPPTNGNGNGAAH